MVLRIKTDATISTSRRPAQTAFSPSPAGTSHLDSGSALASADPPYRSFASRTARRDQLTFQFQGGVPAYLGVELRDYSSLWPTDVARRRERPRHSATAHKREPLPSQRGAKR